MKKEKDEELLKILKKQEEAYEALCLRCGACCGAYDGDPCTKLRKDDDGKYFCIDYENRLGAQKTVKGQKIHCVFIEEILHYNWPGSENCPYKKLKKNPYNI